MGDAACSPHQRDGWGYVSVVSGGVMGYHAWALPWRADREAEGARLLSEYSPKDYLGFESPALRQSILPGWLARPGFTFCLTVPLDTWHYTFCTRRYLSWIEGLTTNQNVTGSNPVRRTICRNEPRKGLFLSLAVPGHNLWPSLIQPSLWARCFCHVGAFCDMWVRFSHDGFQRPAILSMSSGRFAPTCID